MVRLRRAEERGRTRMGWLDSYHSFSFGGYYDPENEGFRSLRVINDDIVAGGGGFPTHPHRDMEIVTYVLEGGLAHRDSTGTEAVIRPGDVQRMSAGTGITHSEYNASASEPVHLLQIWIFPERQGLTPGYEEKRFDTAEKRGRLRLLASRDGRDGSVTIHQDAALYGTVLEKDEAVSHALGADRHAWVHVATGEAEVNGQALKAGDAAALSGEEAVEIRGLGPAEVLVFDLA
jgi:quercetin 2,3-dioxygenase